MKNRTDILVLLIVALVLLTIMSIAFSSGRGGSNQSQSDNPFPFTPEQLENNLNEITYDVESPSSSLGKYYEITKELPYSTTNFRVSNLPIYENEPLHLMVNETGFNGKSDFLKWLKNNYEELIEEVIITYIDDEPLHAPYPPNQIP